MSLINTAFTAGAANSQRKGNKIAKKHKAISVAHLGVDAQVLAHMEYQSNLLRDMYGLLAEIAEQGRQRPTP